MRALRIILLTGTALLTSFLNAQPSPDTEMEQLRIFRQAITLTELGNVLENSGSFTVFAPTDTAFSKLPGAAKGLMDIDSDLHAPPVCLFVWGAFIFPCIIERVNKRFTMFLPEGIPVGATLSVTLKEYKEYETQLQEAARQSADRTKTWRIKEGDSLWFIAAKEYGDPGLWRPIAEANNIDNPRILESGVELIIPPLE